MNKPKSRLMRAVLLITVALYYFSLASPRAIGTDDLVQCSNLVRRFKSTIDPAIVLGWGTNLLDESSLAQANRLTVGQVPQAIRLALGHQEPISAALVRADQKANTARQIVVTWGGGRELYGVAIGPIDVLKGKAFATVQWQTGLFVFYRTLSK